MSYIFQIKFKIVKIWFSHNFIENVNRRRISNAFTKFIPQDRSKISSTVLSICYSIELRPIRKSEILRL